MAKDGKRKRESAWRAHVAAWKAGCGSQAEYCRQHGLTQNDFSWWKREIARRDANVETAAPTFIPMKLAAQRMVGHAFELTLRWRAVIAVWIGCGCGDSERGGSRAGA